mmetsp:Transcript_19986/g.31196  ORF Transcript_19986/g.31196 Transcript_19986/m.31196 type:complete len:101 (-) Transcript_19986:556-858(-)
MRNSDERGVCLDFVRQQDDKRFERMTTSETHDMLRTDALFNKIDLSNFKTSVESLSVTLEEPWREQKIPNHADFILDSFNVLRQTGTSVGSGKDILQHCA